MSMRIFITFIALAAIACASPEERCNAARVVAHDRWATYEALARAEANSARDEIAAVEAPAMAMRDGACDRAWAEYTSALTRRVDGRFVGGPTAVGFAASITAARRHRPDACSDPRPAHDIEAERIAVASGSIPTALVQARDAALREALAAYTPVAASRERASALTTRARAAAAARDASLGPAVAARDTWMAVPQHGESAERAAADEASSNSWDLCQAVDP